MILEDMTNSPMMGDEERTAGQKLGVIDPIGEKEIQEANTTLQKYKDGKASLENRMVENEQWWKLRHWDYLRRRNPNDAPNSSPEPTSAWLFNAIIAKHADAMDNYPEAVVLPREQSDQGSAEILSEILPTIFEYSNFEQTYSDAWFEKLKHGTAAYTVLWDQSLNNGLGDISIQNIDMLKVFWEPGITDIQKSRNLFVVDLMDTDLLEARYPQFKGKLGGNTSQLKQYIYDDSIDTSEKSLVVDWYYKKMSDSGKTVLHYVKFSGDCLLFSSENLPEYAESGWYNHGQYPIVMDVLFPEKGTPAGFGYVAVCKDPQLYIDKLGGNILETSMMGSKRRYFVSRSSGIDKDQLLDWNEPLVEVDGEINDNRVRELSPHALDGVYYNVLQGKIEEMKETASNRDVSNGSSASGITAASAIAALQEAGSKVSRDIIASAYRAHTLISRLTIELIRQFYDETRAFRITAPDGTYSFANFSNGGLKSVQTGFDGEGNPLFREPVFDLKIKAQKRSPFSRMEQNELAKELYNMGFFNPDRAQESLIALGLMDFEGIEDIRQQVSEGQTLMNMLQQMSQQMERMSQLLDAVAGGALGAAPAGPEGPAPSPEGGPSTPVTDGRMQAQKHSQDTFKGRVTRNAKVDMGDFRP